MSAITLGEFAEEAGWICRTTPEEARPARVAPLIGGLLSHPRLLDAAARACPAAGYGRNTIHVDPDGLFSVIAAVWPPGICTPIHDHKVWCAVGLYEGRMQQRHYLPTDPAGGCDGCYTTEVVDMVPGDTCDLPVRDWNIHSMHNPYGETAISIHVYGGNTHEVGPNLLKIYKA